MAPTTMYLIYITVLLGIPLAAIWRSFRRFTQLEEEMRAALAAFDGALNRRLALFPRMHTSAVSGAAGGGFDATTEMNSLAARMNGVEERQRFEALIQTAEKRFLALAEGAEATALAGEIRILAGETAAAREAYNRLVSKNRKLHDAFFSGLAAALLSCRKAEYLAGPPALEMEDTAFPEA